MKRVITFVFLLLVVALVSSVPASAISQTYFFLSGPQSSYDGQTTTLDEIPINYSIFSSDTTNSFYTYYICPFVFDDFGHSASLPASYCTSFYMNGFSGSYSNSLSGYTPLYYPGVNNISCFILSSKNYDQYQECTSSIRVNHLVLDNPVYRMANWKTHERLFTTNWNEVIGNDGVNGWVYEGVSFKAPSTFGNGAAVYRMANWQTKERLFTTDWNEVQNIKDHNGWVYEGTAFYAN